MNHRLRVGAAMILAASVLSACRETDQKDPLSVRAVAAVSAEQAGVDTTFDFYAADMTMTMSGANVGFPHPTIQRVVSLHVERSLGADGYWTTTEEIQPSNQFGQSFTRGPSKYEIVKVVSRDDGESEPVFTDRSGTIKTVSSLRTKLEQAKSLFPQVKFSPPPTPPAPQKKSARLRRDPRAWLDELALSPSARARNRANVAKHFGAARGKVRNMDRFVETHDSVTAETLFDDALGAVMERNVTVNGHAQSHTEYRYEKLPNGLLFRTYTKHTVGGSGPKDPTRFFETRLANVRIERRGGAQ